MEATGAVKQSSADLLMLQSLDAKLKELTEAAGIPMRSAASVASAACESTVQTAPTPATSPNERSGVRGVDSPAIDSTQTVRPLTSLEFESGEASRWFAIELILSAHEIDAARIPNLSIFEEYRLYSVSGSDQGRPLHALRLGFFSSEVAAAAVVRYLASFFPSATLRRVSIAEHERFAVQLVRAGKDIGESGTRLAVELVTAPTGARPPVPNLKP